MTFPEISLAAAVRETLCRKLLALPSPFEDYSTFAPLALSVCASLPPEILKTILDLRDVPKACGAIRLRNLWQDSNLPDTPYEGHVSDKKPFSEGYCVGLGLLLGTVIGYGERDSFIQEITPRQGKESSASSEGSAVDFGFHIDYAAVCPRPNFMLLACLRGDQDGAAKSHLIATKTLCKYLDQESLATLREPEFKIRSPGDFAEGHEAWWSAPKRS